MKNRKSMTCASCLEEAFELIKPSNKKGKNKDMSGTMLLHPAFHPKDISRNKLQTMFNTICKERLQDFLKIDECMINHHNTDNFRKLNMPSSLKQFEVIENSANYHANKVGTQMMAKGIDMRKKANEIIENERIPLQRIRITNNQLKISRIKTHKNVCDKKLVIRREGQRRSYKH